MAVSTKLPRLQPLPGIWHLRRIKGSLRRAEARPLPGFGAAISVPAFSVRHFAHFSTAVHSAICRAVAPGQSDRITRVRKVNGGSSSCRRWK